MSTTEHRAICPTCGRLAVRETAREKGPIVEATFSCQRGHLWQSKWMKEAA